MSWLRCGVTAKAARLRTDQRGVSPVVFAAVGVVLLAFVGLGVEGGLWYLEKRQGQNAADAAALSGAIAAYVGQSGSSVATTVATKNGYTNNVGGATVTVSSTTANDSTGTSRPAIQVTVTRAVPRLFSSLMLGAGNTPVSETAAALIGAGSGPDCALALSGGISFAGSTSVTLNACEMVSNNTSSTSISMQGAAAVTGGALISAGGCSGCTGIPFLTNQLPSPDPLLGIQSVSMPNFGGNCNSNSKLSVSWLNSNMGSSYTIDAATYAYTNSNKVAICGAGNGNGTNTTLSTNSGTTLNFQPGTYFFNNSNVSFNGGTVTCSACTPGGAGVTIVLTGTSSNKIGTLSIGAGANVTLNAPATNSFDPAFDGVLFYMDKNATDTNGNGNAPVNLTGNSTSVLSGAMYFPSVTVDYIGNMTGSDPSHACTEVVANTITMGGNSTLSVSGCATDGAAVGQYMVVEMVK